MSLMQTRIDDRVRFEVLRALCERGLTVIPLKGAVLGPWLYGQKGVRPSNDLDVLLAPGEDAAAECVMAELGYVPAKRRQRPWHELRSHERAFWRGVDLPVELHRHVTQVPRFRLPVGDVLARTVPWHWEGLVLRRLDDADQFLTLIIHAVHHQFMVPLISWVDLMLLLERGVDLGVVEDRARQCGALPALRIAAELLWRYFDCADLLPYTRPLSAMRKQALRGIRTDWPGLRETRGPLRDRWHAFWLIDRTSDGVLFAMDYALRWVLDRPFEWGGMHVGERQVMETESAMLPCAPGYVSRSGISRPGLRQEGDVPRYPGNPSYNDSNHDWKS